MMLLTKKLQRLYQRNLLKSSGIFPVLRPHWKKILVRKQGAREAAANGVLAGYPVTDIKIVLTSEFRTPVRNSLGAVVEPPSGSSWSEADFALTPEEEEEEGAGDGAPATHTVTPARMLKLREVAREELQRRERS